MIPVRKALQHPINLLGFFGEFHLQQQLSNGHVDGFAKERKGSHVFSQGDFVKFIVRLG